MLSGRIFHMTFDAHVAIAPERPRKKPADLSKRNETE